MGQKTHPYAFRLGVVSDWKSRWYSDTEYSELVNQDWKIRDYLKGEVLRGAISRIAIERLREQIVDEIFTARPGVVIGRRGSEAERLRTGLEKLTGLNVKLNVTEIKDADTDAAILARGIADQLENRVAFRRAMKRAVQSAMKAGAEGVRVECKGRLGGADMGRREWYREGRVPLHTLRADVDYGEATARTTVGAIGIKCWVYKGDVVPSLTSTREKIAAEAALAAGAPQHVAPIKARAEEAAGEDRSSKLIEAGGGKRLIEAGGGRRKGEGRPEPKTTKDDLDDGSTDEPEAADSEVATRDPLPATGQSEEAVSESTEAVEAPTETEPSSEREAGSGEPVAAPEEAPAEDAEGENA